MKIDKTARNRVSQASKKFRKTAAEAADGANFNVEDGSYRATLDEVALEEGKGGELKLFLRWKLEDSEEVVCSRYRLEDGVSLGYLKKDLLAFKLPANDDTFDLLEELEDGGLIDELAEREALAKIQVRNQPPFQNVYLNQVLEIAEAENGEEEEEVDLSEMSKKELLTYIEEEELEIEIKKGASVKKIRKLIEEALEDEEEEEEDEEEDSEDEEEEEEEVALDKMTTKELKAYAEEEGIELGKAKTKKAILAKIEAAPDDEEEDEPGELKKGMEVIVMHKKKEKKAKILLLDEENERVKVKLLKDKKTVTVDLDDVIVEE